MFNVFVFFNHKESQILKRTCIFVLFLFSQSYKFPFETLRRAFVNKLKGILELLLDYFHFFRLNNTAIYVV